MFKRINSSERTDTRETPAHFEPEKTEYVEYRMNVGNRQPSDDAESETREYPSVSADGTLFSEEEARALRADWETVQAGFVDNPQHAVKHADELVERAIRQIGETLNRERETLESEWDAKRDVSTEDLRVVLQRYRSLLNRLLTM